jgi:short-subunit dehydrogenase
MAFALVTGASKGIGKSIAHELARKKQDLFLLARSERLLEQLALELRQQYQVRAKYLAIDLSAPDATTQILSFIEKDKLGISILVNNAGYGLWGRFEKLDLQQQLNMLRLNNESMVSLTYALLPLLQKQSRSYILNVASTTAYQAIPYLTVYAASKAFVVSFSRGLSGELKNTGVSVTCLSPGATDTNFMLVAGMNTTKLLNSANKVSMTPDEVAAQAIKALFNNQLEFIPGLINKVTAFANNILPKKMVERIAANIYKPVQENF